MQLGMFLVIVAIIHGLLGLIALLAPGLATGMFGITVDTVGTTLIRLLGATLLGTAAIFWFARTLIAADVLKAVLIGGFVISGLSLIIAVFALTNGIIGPRGWIGVAGRSVLTLGFGYFAFVKQPASRI